MEKVNHAFEKVKMLVGMEADEEEATASADSSFMDDFNRDCTLSTKQVHFFVFLYLSLSLASGLLLFTCRFSQNEIFLISMAHPSRDLHYHIYNFLDFVVVPN